MDRVKKNFGFGCMLLPMQNGEIDLAETSRMVDAFLDAGFNYFDTAHGYLQGKSEKTLKTCLTSRYLRDRYILTDKLTENFFKIEADIRPVFESQLEACGVDYFDFYLMHSQGSTNYQHFKDCRAYETAFELKAEGKVRHVGLSFHDKADVLEDILKQYPQVEFVQIQLNYLDYDDPAVQGRQCYEMCRKYNKPVIVMEPVKGGALAALPEKAGRLLEKLSLDASQASYAIRFAESLPQVEIVLSGMNTMEQLLDNLACRQPLTEYEQSVLFEAAGLLRNSIAVPCTGCGYCVSGCPKKIHIPEYFRLYNEYKQNPGDGWKIAPVYQNMTASGGGPADCIGCKKCERVCEFGAITVENNCAHIDPEKCTNCGKCAAKCPAKVIQ